MLFFKKKEQKEFNIPHFWLGNTIYGMLNVSLISVMLVPFIKSLEFSPVKISALISLKEVFRFIFTFIGGIIFDRFGPRTTFVFGRVVDIISLVLLLNPTFTNVVIAMALIGISYGITYGKYSSYIYNTLSIHDKLHIYGRTTAEYYFSWDIALTIASSISAILLKNHGYNVLVVVSIMLKIAALAAVVKFVPSNKTGLFKEFKSASTKEIVLSVAECVKKSKMFTWLLSFYGVLNFITWPLAAIIGHMLLLDMGWTDVQVATYTTILTIIMTASTLIPITILPNGISLKKCFVINAAELAATLFAVIIYSPYLFVLSCFAMCATFSTIEVSVERRFEHYSNKKIRGSAISVSMSLATIINVIATMFIGFVAKYISYHIGAILLVFPLVVFGFAVVKYGSRLLAKGD
ncbi:MAG: MFS transporter [Rickettsiales bacterium]|nr:MFS transporter [Rickettsiales bacterium]